MSCFGCVCLYMDTMTIALRKSHRHRSELKHLFIIRAPPLNQTEPDPRYWPPDRDYNVVWLRTAGPSHTLLSVLLTTQILRPYRLELSDAVQKLNSTENVDILFICSVQIQLYVVLLPMLPNETEQVVHQTLTVFFQQGRKLMKA